MSTPRDSCCCIRLPISNHSITNTPPRDVALRRIATHSIIRTFLMLVFWAVALPIAALISFPWAFATGDIRLLYRLGMWGARTGVSIAGVSVNMIGLDRLDPKATYIFMCNHVSNIDPLL